MSPAPEVGQTAIPTQAAAFAERSPPKAAPFKIVRSGIEGGALRIRARQVEKTRIVIASCRSTSREKQRESSVRPTKTVFAMNEFNRLPFPIATGRTARSACTHWFDNDRSLSLRDSNHKPPARRLVGAVRARPGFVNLPVGEEVPTGPFVLGDVTGCPCYQMLAEITCPDFIRIAALITPCWKLSCSIPFTSFQIEGGA